MDHLAGPVDRAVGEEDGLGFRSLGLPVLPLVGPDVPCRGQFLAAMPCPEQVAAVLRGLQREGPILVGGEGWIGDAGALVVEVPD